MGRCKASTNCMSSQPHVHGGASVGVENQFITDRQEGAAAVMKDYPINDIFIMDETGLFYSMNTDRSLLMDAMTNEQDAIKRDTLSRVGLGVYPLVKQIQSSRLSQV